MHTQYRDVLIRDWQPGDRTPAFEVICSVLAEYNLGCEPDGTDWDAFHVEEAYWQTGGEFWVVEHRGQVVGTAGYYPVERGEKAVEIRKMYLHPSVRGHGLGRYLLQALEEAIATRHFRQIWIETASVLKEATKLYESSGYQPSSGVETARCDRIYVKILGNRE
ncbi:GNAT family N-acetyltransferase [Oscillatoria sp. FACHB-1407]|uniref:GNAT family N-acetyltransferase n=1 Tax=Oscillatoria sp. FACHB-1407 TaxID=2692847 RepID=UPI001683F2AB|nr:GNAT family N-acetyltransferase [Oscillatoria sp. FACHB-1407]MBD2461518.1 GNAT family N-acetyltransferase [Oscillatoria sp. FACHB-1407]